ncbi:MAG: hypothetical protein PHN75_11620 [Syntrophales bacterium]|nr:hypothetical protein [Syntrophales bacterium]
MINHNEGPTTYDVTNFTIREVTECGRAVRTMGVGASSMEEVAGRIVRYLHDTLIDGQTGERACPLIRFFKTQAYEALDDELKAFALNLLGGGTPLPEMKCMTLLGTVGENQEWNSRGTSKGHKAIPLPSEEVVHQLPMVRNLIKQLGMSVRSVVKPDPALLLDMEQKSYGVFLVPEALGSPYIPAQEEFVVPYGIKSVTGFGGMLPSLDIFVMIMFLKTSISREAADLLKNLSLNIKLAVLPFEKTVFAHTGKDAY